MTSTDKILSRIDIVLRENKRIEWTYILLTVILFSTGIACFITALTTGTLPGLPSLQLLPVCSTGRYKKSKK